MAKKRLSFSLILRLAEIVLGAVFIASGIGKMTNAADFGELISNYGLEWLSILKQSSTHVVCVASPISNF